MYNIKPIFIFILSTVLLLAILPKCVSAQADTIQVNAKRLNTANLKPGLRQYLVYYHMPQKPKSVFFWLWLRDTKLGERNGEKVLVTTQHWYGNDSLTYRAAYSVNRQRDFSPLYHSETVAGKIKAYNWSADKITGADTVAGNTAKDFLLAFDVPCLNWNLDIETFEMLPLAANKTFAINFYDAGSGKPALTYYKVIGSEVIQTLDSQQVDCWKLFYESDHNGQHGTETFWISKKNHEFLKEEDSFAGGYRYKVKMAGAATDIAQRFNKK